MADGYVVDPVVLRKAGDGIVTVTDELNHDISAWAGEQQGATGANQGFASAQAVGDCEAGWEQALSVLGADLATAGDTLSMNAANYAATEQQNAGRFGPRPR